MKVAMVSEHASPLAPPGGVDAGGQNIHVAALARNLAALGHDVVVYTRRDNEDTPTRIELGTGVEVVHVAAGPPRQLSKDVLLPYIGDFGDQLATFWQWDRPDVIHTHFWMSAIAGLAGRRSWPAPLVHTFHALGTVKRRYQGLQDTSPRERIRLERTVGRAVDRIVATCSDEVRELTLMGIRPSKVTVIPCGVDIDQFHPNGSAAERVDCPRVLAIGRMVERKGFDTAVAAMVNIPSAELVIAGGPPADRIGDDSEAQRLYKCAEEYAVADRVRLLGSVAPAEMPALIRSADVVVNVPWYEPFGIVPLEAMACGRPIVASEVGGLLDTVLPGATGLLVPPRKPAALARAVRDLLADPAIRERYGLAARHRAEARYSWSRIAADTATVYADVVANNRDGAVTKR